jgi:hypothetical protein
VFERIMIMLLIKKFNFLKSEIEFTQSGLMSIINSLLNLTNIVKIGKVQKAVESETHNAFSFFFV